jgi:uncharacterized protein (DUF433 family)
MLAAVQSWPAEAEPVAVNWTERIEVDGTRLGGKPVVRGSRIPVELVVEMVADGWSEERIMTSYPTLTEADIRACLHYAAALLREEKRFRLPAAE